MEETKNIKALISAIFALFGFIFLPWIGTDFENAGSIIFANTIFETIGTSQDPWIWIVLFAVAVGLIASLYGIFNQNYAIFTSWISFAAGIFALTYFAATLFSAHPEPTVAPGLGYITALLGSLGLLLQIMPDVNIARKVNKLSFVRTAVRLKDDQKLAPYLFIVPGLILYAIWVVYPAFSSFYMSLLRWDFISEPVFVGLENYKRLFSDASFILSIGNNLRWLFVFLLVPTVLGLALALLLNENISASGVFKVCFFFPYVLSFPVVGLVWAWVFNPSMGLVNPILAQLGMQDLPGWLGDRALAIWVIIIAASWRQVGYVMILYLAGLKGIDNTLIEAARIDGANRFQIFRRVIFPLLNPITVIVVVVSVIDSLRAFDLVSIMTRGGQDTQVLANLMYMETFNNYKMGYGASIAVVLTLIISIFIFFYIRWMMKREVEF
jgi:ABC-type sugar transport system permease subunit